MRWRKKTVIDSVTGIHAIEKDLRCCGILFARSGNLNRHYESLHSDLPKLHPSERSDIIIKDESRCSKEAAIQYVPFPAAQVEKTAWTIKGSARTPGTQDERAERRKNGGVLYLKKLLLQYSEENARLLAECRTNKEAFEDRDAHWKSAQKVIEKLTEENEQATRNAKSIAEGSTEDFLLMELEKSDHRTSIAQRGAIHLKEEVKGLKGTNRALLRENEDLKIQIVRLNWRVGDIAAGLAPKLYAREKEDDS